MENIISAWHGDEFSWIRCVGKGSFTNSPQLKDWAENDLSSGTTTMVVDLEECTGMDSTFMGTLAGLAMKLMRQGNGKLQIASADEKNKASLIGLGLSAMIDIDPAAPCWTDQAEIVREKLKQCADAHANDQASHVLEAHKKLCAADQRNTEKFATVLDYLEAEVSERQNKDRTE